MKRLIQSIRLLVATLFLVLSSGMAVPATVAANHNSNHQPGNTVICPTGTGLFQQGNNCKVTICHANSAVSNPYSSTPVDINAADGGGDNGDHYDEHNDPVFNNTMQQGDDWGDIIPPITGSHAGLNWDAAGQAIWNNGCAVPSQPVSPNGVTFIDLCGTANDTYTITSTAGVTYKIGSTVTAAGTYSGTGTVTVTATADSGYTLTGTTSWNHTFTTNPCPVNVTPSDVTFNDQCGTANDTYTVPSTTGVTYDQPTGTYPGVDVVTVMAAADSGYVLNGASSWVYSFTDEDCPPEECPDISSARTSIFMDVISDTPDECDVCPNLDGVQATVPDGYAVDQFGDCIQPGRGGGETPPAIVTTGTPPTLPTVSGGLGAGQLLDTGSSVALNVFAGLAILGITASLGAASRFRPTYS